MIFRSATFVWALVAAQCALGHQSPVHLVDELSAEIVELGASEKLLTVRGFEHQSLGNWSAAAADFKSAIKLNPRATSAIFGYAEALLEMEFPIEAEAMALSGAAFGGSVDEQAPFHAIRARAFARQQRWDDALDAWRLSLRSQHSEVDWFLGEEECLTQLQRLPERVEALAQARSRNPSIVLHRAWIRALVDAGEFEKASNEIEQGLAKSRWQSSWLLLRAQLHGQNQHYSQQKADATTAFSEIQSRLNIDRPDPFLVLDAARALLYMGEDQQALVYLDHARSLGVPESELIALRKKPERVW